MNLLSSGILNMGKVLICADGFIRGGNWNNGANTGAFTLNLNNAPSNTNTNIGFRCASDLDNSSLRQNEQYISKDLYSGFKRSQSFLHHRSSAYENIKPLSRPSDLLKSRANREKLEKGRVGKSACPSGESLGGSGLLFEKLCQFEHLLNSYHLARRDNRYKRQVCKFDLFLENNLFKLRWELLTNCYYPYPYTYFVVTDPKTRHVAAPNFRDRVFHHALVSLVEPLFDKSFIEDAYACRKGKGTHFAKNRLKKFLQSARSVYGKETNLYILQCDITKFFPSISWDILINLTNKKIDCPKIRELIVKIITTHKVFLNKNKIQSLPTEVISIEERKGLPIGNLTSQLFANIYLNELDHFIKENLKERWYGRYMDDFYIIHPDNKHLSEVKGKIQDFLWEKLRLSLHPKKSVIQNVKNGVAFVGYRIYWDHVLIRAKTLQRFQRRLKKRTKQVQKGGSSQKSLELMKSSFSGHLDNANAYRLKAFLFDQDLR